MSHGADLDHFQSGKYFNYVQLQIKAGRNQVVEKHEAHIVKHVGGDGSPYRVRLMPAGRTWRPAYRPSRAAAAWQSCDWSSRRRLPAALGT